MPFGTYGRYWVQSWPQQLFRPKFLAIFTLTHFMVYDVQFKKGQAKLSKHLYLPLLWVQFLAASSLLDDIFLATFSSEGRKPGSSISKFLLHHSYAQCGLFSLICFCPSCPVFSNLFTKVMYFSENRPQRQQAVALWWKSKPSVKQHGRKAIPLKGDATSRGRPSVWCHTEQPANMHSRFPTWWLK